MSSADNWVGFSAITVLGYTFVLIAIHMFIPHPSASKRVIRLSYVSLTLLAIAQACIVGTYFVPHISGMCICTLLWWIAATCYITSIYCIKLVYIERVNILNKHPMLASKSVGQWIRYLTYSLIASYLVSVGMLFALSDGECHEDLTRNGCIPKITDGNLIQGIAMVSIDAILFMGFCWKWWKLINVFKLSKDNDMLVDMVQSFSVQCMVTIIAMLSCIIDGIINLQSQEYSIKIIFCVDCAVIASCNFAMIKESQAFMWRYLCWPCKIPRFLMRNGSDATLKAPAPVIPVKPREPTKPNELPRSKPIESQSKLKELPIHIPLEDNKSDDMNAMNKREDITITPMPNEENIPPNTQLDTNNISNITNLTEPPETDENQQDLEIPSYTAVKQNGSSQSGSSLNPQSD